MIYLIIYSIGFIISIIIISSFIDDFNDIGYVLFLFWPFLLFIIPLRRLIKGKWIWNE